MRWPWLVAASFAAALFACTPRAAAQASAAEEMIALSFHEYMERVDSANLALAAARLTLPIAQAGTVVARVRPNPSVTAGLLQVDISSQGAPTASYLGVNLPFELGGKRRRRIAVAEASTGVVEAEVATVQRDVRVEAAVAYVDALEAALVLDLRRRTLEGFERLVEVNRQRFELGDIGETTYLQSRVEAQRFRAELLSAEGEVRAANLTLAIYASGDVDAAFSVVPQGDLHVPPRGLDESELLARAQTSRPELVRGERSVTRAQRQLDLARSLRIVDSQLTVGWVHNGSTTEPQFRQHWNDVLGVQLTLPLPISNRYRGTLQVALASIQQAEMELDAQRLRVGVEVRRALAQYRAAVERLALYDESLLSGADEVLSRYMYEYQRGGSTLLEVLVAQRTANDVRAGYYEALADHVRALIRLEAAAGIWDVSL